jgi:methylated-DNA-protein-cysteine methyltransferase-like protein
MSLYCSKTGIKMNAFYIKIYDIVSKIPKGKVATYGQIAFLAGKPRAARVAGCAMHMAPMERKLPCHRVVNKQGSMSPEHVFGGEDIQRALLAQEGITFQTNGCIDMKKHLWRPEKI